MIDARRSDETRELEFARRKAVIHFVHQVHVAALLLGVRILLADEMIEDQSVQQAHAKLSPVLALICSE